MNVRFIAIVIMITRSGSHCAQRSEHSRRERFASAIVAISCCLSARGVTTARVGSAVLDGVQFYFMDSISS